ncbi:MAG: FIG004453: protein YceG like, partial [uncultured Frankineae bacterium]
DGPARPRPRTAARPPSTTAAEAGRRPRHRRPGGAGAHGCAGRRGRLRRPHGVRLVGGRGLPRTGRRRGGRADLARRHRRRRGRHPRRRGRRREPPVLLRGRRGRPPVDLAAARLLPRPHEDARCGRARPAARPGVPHRRPGHGPRGADGGADPGDPRRGHRHPARAVPGGGQGPGCPGPAGLRTGSAGGIPVPGHLRRRARHQRAAGADPAGRPVRAGCGGRRPGGGRAGAGLLAVRDRRRGQPDRARGQEGRRVRQGRPRRLQPARAGDPARHRRLRALRRRQDRRGRGDGGRPGQGHAVREPPPHRSPADPDRVARRGDAEGGARPGRRRHPLLRAGLQGRHVLLHRRLPGVPRPARQVARRGRLL